jgi:hypothetical protein
LFFELILACFGGLSVGSSSLEGSSLDITMGFKESFVDGMLSGAANISRSLGGSKETD